MLINKRLLIRTENRSFSFNSIRRNATDQALFDLGTALNSLQASPATEIQKIERFFLA